MSTNQPSPGNQQEPEHLEAALRESERLRELTMSLYKVANERANTMDAIFQAMTEGIIVADMDGNTQVLNKAASNFLGVQKQYRSHLSDLLRRYPPYSVEGRGVISLQSFAMARALRGERIRAERFMVRRADGEERILEINIAPLQDDQGQQIGIVSAFRDVTEMIQAEQRIRLALTTMLHVAEAVSGLTDIRTILRSVLEQTLATLNCRRGAIYQLDEQQYTFLPLLTLGFTPETEQQWLEEQQAWLDPSPARYHVLYQQLLAGHAALINAEQYPPPLPHLPDHMNVLAAPIKHNNRVHGLLVLDRSQHSGEDRLHSPQDAFNAGPSERQEFSIWDIAVLDGIAQLAGLAVEQAHWQQEAINARANEEALRQANEAKDEFMAITAHEFRSPLTVILAQSQLVTRTLARLTKELPDLDRVNRATKNLSIIEEQTHHLTDIVKTFLEVAHINRGQLTLEMSEVDIAGIARQVVDQLAATSEHHTISCDIKADQQPYMVKGDSARLQQIIANLVQNAIKYSPFGGPIAVHLCHVLGDDTRPLIEVCVEDQGIGIPPEFQSHLFERFYRTPGSLASKTGGIGLGLYIVAQLIQLQGGTVHVESSGILGEGSRFIFTLPAVESSDQL